jgi:hypothetical protein
MAKYSYTSGMENRGLDWVFIPIVPQFSQDIKASRTSLASKNVSNAFFTIFGSTSYKIVILENYIIPDGQGGFFVCIYFYNQNDSRRLPGDTIRFHDGAQDLPTNFKP